jgi:phosphate transport system permease protein
MSDLVTRPPSPVEPLSFHGRGRDRLADRLFRGTATGAGLVVVAGVCLVGAFLVVQAVPALARNEANFLTSRVFEVDGGTLRFGIADLLWTTVASSALALLIAVPLAVAVALFLTQYAPRRIAGPAAALVDLLAAVPSIVYGLLGLALFINWLHVPRGSPLVGGLVLALMALPTVIIATRSALKAVPPSIREAALGVGASKAQTVFHHVLPLAMPGVMTGAILSLAHALGETAPLLMIGMVAFVPGAPESFTSSATVLPVQVFIWENASERAFHERTAAAIIVLLVFMIVMNAAAVILRRRFERRW